MRDQVDGANEIGIPAAFINTTQTPDEQQQVFDAANAGKVKLLYVAPERLETARFRAFATHADIALFAVDEAHCVSQWGQDFRSSYLAIGEFIDSLPDRPTVAAFHGDGDRTRAPGHRQSAGIAQPARHGDGIR